MTHISSPFRFFYPLKQRTVRNLQIVNELIGTLDVQGFYIVKESPDGFAQPEDRFAIDIDFVRWNGTDIKPVLALTGIMDDVQLAALHHCELLTENHLQQAA